MPLPTTNTFALQDTGDTRETPAIDVCKGLIGDNAKLNIYDPQVSQKQMLSDLSTPKFEWDHPSARQAASAAIEKQVIQSFEVICTAI